MLVPGLVFVELLGQAHPVGLPLVRRGDVGVGKDLIEDAGHPAQNHSQPAP